MKTFTFICILKLVSIVSYSQSFFSKIPDFGGDKMEGIIYNVIPLEGEIKIIGLLHKSLVPGFDGGTWPILGTLTYDGEYLVSDYLVDSMYSDGFYYFTRRLTFKNDSICYLYDRRNLGAPFLDAYLVELNYKTGKILRSKIIYDQTSSHESFLAMDMTIGKNGNIFLVNVTDKFGPHPQLLTVLDSNLNFQFQTLIPNYGRGNFTRYIEEDSEGNLVLIGTSLGNASSGWFESKLFRQVLDKDYNSISFQLALTSYDQSILVFDAYPVIKSKTGDWIFATQLRKVNPNCHGCFIRIPYVVSVSYDFTEVLWETRVFGEGVNSTQPIIYIRSITEVSDGYIFAGESDGEFGIETSGVLGKVSLSGDSLWLKHYIPVDWDTVQGRWFKWQDIKTTPAGNILVGGFGSDRYAAKIVPWILHLDDNGCLEPGCNITSVSQESINHNIDLTISPNPASKQCNINVRVNLPTYQDYKLRIITNSGILVREIPINGNDINLFLNVEHFSPGTYFVQLADSKKQHINKKFIVVD